MKSYEEMTESVFCKKEEYIKLRSNRRKKVLSALCILLVCGIAVTAGIIISENGGDILTDNTSSHVEKEDTNQKYPEINKLPQKIIPSTGTSSESVEMTAKVPKWDELTITGQYYEAEYNGVSYSGRSKTVDKNNIGEKIEIITVKGLDEYTSILHKKQVTAYEINKISPNCAIAVQFEGDSNYYIYTNPFYRPETLGDFIEDLSLKDFLTVGKVYYDNSTGMGDSYVNETIEFTGLEVLAVWDILLNDSSLRNVYSDSAWYVNKMSISVNMPYLGYRNISISLTEDGYLWTNILDTGKAFYIGADRVEEFTRHLIDNCEGLRIIYEPDDDQPKSGNKNNSSQSVSSETASYSPEN